MKLRVLWLAVLGLALVACAPGATLSRLAGASPLPIPAPLARSIGGLGGPTSADEDAVKQVIERANAEQAQAIASGDPSMMADTATPAYYREIARTNQALLAAGVTRIELVKLEWGAVSVKGTSATATTFETWRTTYQDGTTDQSRDRNVYTLTKEGGAWKIAADRHPDDGLGQPGVSAPGGPAPALAAAPGLDTSRNWAGYAASGGTFTAVSGTWTVPQPAADAAGAGATWVGIGGLRGRDLIQAGTQETVLGTGRVQYRAWVEMLPNVARTVPLVVHPGDSVTVSLSEQAPGSWLIRMNNNTTGQDYQQTVTYTSSHSSAEWIVEAPSAGRGTVPLEAFGTVTFTGGGAVKNGKAVTIAGAGGQPITMISATGQALAVPSALTGDGTGFSVTRTAAAATGPGSGVLPGRRRG